MLQLIVYATQPLGLHGQTVQSTYPQESLCPKYLIFLIPVPTYKYFL